MEWNGQSYQWVETCCFLGFFVLQPGRQLLKVLHLGSLTLHLQFLFFIAVRSLR